MTGNEIGNEMAGNGRPGKFIARAVESTTGGAMKGKRPVRPFALAGLMMLLVLAWGLAGVGPVEGQAGAPVEVQPGVPAGLPGSGIPGQVQPQAPTQLQPRFPQQLQRRAPGVPGGPEQGQRQVMSLGSGGEVPGLILNETESRQGWEFYWKFVMLWEQAFERIPAASGVVVLVKEETISRGTRKITVTMNDAVVYQGQLQRRTNQEMIEQAALRGLQGVQRFFRGK